MSTLGLHGNCVVVTPPLEWDAAWVFPFSRERGSFWGVVSGRFPEKARERCVFLYLPITNTRYKGYKLFPGIAGFKWWGTSKGTPWFHGSGGGGGVTGPWSRLLEGYHVVGYPRTSRNCHVDPITATRWPRSTPFREYRHLRDGSIGERVTTE